MTHSTAAAMFTGVWLLLLSAAGITFRRRLARLLLRWSDKTLPEAERLRDLAVGIVLLGCFGVVMAASGLTMAVLGGLPSFSVIIATLTVAAPLNFAYWLRFRRAGLWPLRRS